MKIREEIVSRKEKLKTQIDHILHTAAEAYGNKQNEWQKVTQDVGLKNHGVVNQQVIKHPGHKAQAALPREVRQLLVKVRDNEKQYLKEQYKVIEELEDVALSISAEEKLDHLKHFVNNLVEAHIVQYIKQSKPPVSTGSIFGNAFMSTKMLSIEKARSSTKKCVTCGAPRPSDTDLSICDYCGGNF